jgi:hypothetical protein
VRQPPTTPPSPRAPMEPRSVVSATAVRARMHGQRRRA